MNRSRGSLRVALLPDQWVTLFQKEDPYADPAFFYHHVSFSLFAELGDNVLGGPVNFGAVTQNVETIIQDSPDGITWTTIYRHPTVLRPGGRVSIDFRHVQRYVRVLLFSHGGGIVSGTMVDPEEQVLPQLLQTAPACASFCECDCETGSEAVG